MSQLYSNNESKHDTVVGRTPHWRKVKLLLWKNWLQPLNNKVDTMQALVYIIVVFGAIIILRIKNTATHEPIKRYTSIDVMSTQLYKNMIVQKLPAERPNDMLLYSPKNSIYEKIIDAAAKKLNLNGIKAYESARDLEVALAQDNYLAGVQFDDETAEINDYPKKLNYTLRFPSELRTTNDDGKLLLWDTNKLFPHSKSMGPRNADENDGGSPSYLKEAFLPVQHAVAIAYLEQASKQNSLNLKMLLQRFPYPSYLKDPLIESQFSYVFAPMIFQGFLLNINAFLLIYISFEKEKQLKEIMKIIGINNWLHWVAWFGSGFIITAIFSVIMTVILKVPWNNDIAVLNNCNALLLLCFLLSYGISCIALVFVISIFFTKSHDAQLYGTLLLISTIAPYFISDFLQWPLIIQLIVCLFANSAMGYGIKLIMTFEANGQSLNWSNMFYSPPAYNSISLFTVMVMLLFDAFLYMLICLYIEQIYPGEYGVPKKWNFPFERSFWFKPERRENKSDEINEPKVESHEVGLQVVNLRKCFGEHWAVNDITMTLKKHEITVLLGHNGAGKTTLVSMLTGILPPTSGTAIVNGCDIREDLAGARQSLGICPQYDVLFDDMTVREHIMFYSIAKGLWDKEFLENEVNKYLKILQLGDKAKEKSKNLSGGMKRKLSLCCALCGNAKTVICDEPSSGMDPLARRHLWNLLLQEKHGRTILLTTHYMDEADVLGDSIAIMCNGQLKVMDTPFQLKNDYGTGYQLIFVKQRNCRSDKVTDVIKQYIPNIKPPSEDRAELIYELSTSDASKFAKLLAELEIQKVNLNVSGFGINFSTMEDVFMRFGTDILPTDTKTAVNDKTGAQEESVSSKQDVRYKKKNLIRIFLQQFYAMILKRIYYANHNKFFVFLPCIVAACIFVLIFSSNKYLNTGRPMPAMTYDLNQYQSTVIVLETNKAVKKESIESKISNAYKTIIQSKGGSNKFVDIESQNFERYILALEKEQPMNVDSNYVVAATIEPGVLKAWFNNEPLHTAPLAVNLLHTAMVKAILDDKGEIIVSLAPMPYRSETKQDQVTGQIVVGLSLTTGFGMCMSYILPFYMVLPIKERVSGMKAIQYIAGTNATVYWLTNLIFDYCCLTLVSLVSIVVLVCYHADFFSTSKEFLCLILILFDFQLAALLLTYIISFLFDVPSKGIAIAIILYMVPSIGLFFLSISVKRLLENSIFIWILRIFPFSCLMRAIFLVCQINVKLKQCKLFSTMVPHEVLCDYAPSCCNQEGYFIWDINGILPEMISMITIAILFMILIILTEYGCFKPILLYFQKIIYKQQRPELNSNTDNDVWAEHLRVAREDRLDNVSLVTNNMSKYYKRFLAVNNLSLAIEQGECFGLLGVNGCGKTTTFKMLLGLETISYGSASIMHYDVSRNMHKIYGNVGYCPQTISMLEDLTGRELLYVFCLINGIHRNSISKFMLQLVNQIGFSQHFDTQIQHLSGGNKRKLNTAIAIMGNPTVVFLDEPTTGIDPAARRKIWNLILNLRDSGKSIVLSSHSMEECEALCTRVTVMIAGVLKCIGSTQHLKNKFSKGIVLKLKINHTEKSIFDAAEDLKEEWSEDEKFVTEQASSEFHDMYSSESKSSEKLLPKLDLSYVDKNIETVKNFIKMNIPDARLRDEYRGIITYHIDIGSIEWSELFDIIQSNKEKLNIEDYSINQFSLEEIFLEFAMEKPDNEGV